MLPPVERPLDVTYPDAGGHCPEQLLIEYSCYGYDRRALSLSAFILRR